eukprot:gene5876-7299_t
MKRYFAALATRLGTIPGMATPASRKIAAVWRSRTLSPQESFHEAQSGPSELSLAVSAAPLVLSVGAISATGVALSAVPAGLLSAGATLVVVSVEVIGGATVWVLERVSDGVRISLKVAGKLAEGVIVAPGAAVTVSVIGAGTVLSAAGQVIAFIPSEIGEPLRLLLAIAALAIATAAHAGRPCDEKPATA